MRTQFLKEPGCWRRAVFRPNVSELLIFSYFVLASALPACPHCHGASSIHNHEIPFLDQGLGTQVKRLGGEEDPQEVVC
jgi:hypothetical protein